jgi:hypothetical protein
VIDFFKAIEAFSGGELGHSQHNHIRPKAPDHLP